ncbi:hypothetical protein Ndes2526A_g01469 [Nannochloris sp. 'desiccata']|nr:hypothetical protein KSW81_004193 [Chlorella desiccata (nom. nud.)]
MLVAQITSNASNQNAFQTSRACSSEINYQINAPIAHYSSYKAGNGRFQNLYNGRLLAHLGVKRQYLEECAEGRNRAHDPSFPSVYRDIASLDRCTLLLREATRAVQGGFLIAWVHRFSCGGGVGSEVGPIPLVLQVKRQIVDMAKIDEGRYGPAARELRKESACCEEHGAAVMDAVIILVVKMQFAGAREALLGLENVN